MSLSRQLANKLLIRFTTSSGGAVVTTTLSLLPQQQRQSAASSSAVRCCCWWRRQPTTPTTSRRHQSATAIHSAASRRHSLPAASSPLRISLLLQKQATDLRYATMTTATKSEALMASSKGVGTGDANVAATAAAGGGGENLFDRSVFDKTLAVPALRVPAQATAAMLRILRGHTIDLPRMPAVVSDPRDPKARLVLLSPSEFEGAAAKARAEAGGGKGDDDDDGAAASTTAAFLESLPEPARELALSSAASLTSYEIKLTYAHVSVEEALRKLLPADLKELPSAFETVGHIAHLNLREELVPFSKIIGKVLLDKNPRLRVVVNKLSSIQNEFRVFQMEVIAGRENDTVAEVSQGGCRFGLDYAKVYWNSRLEAEHARLVEAEFKPGQVVVDAMAGVGPFAIPAAKFVEGCTVYANDLNPESFRWLAENARRNKVADRVRASCCDARAFIRAFGGVDSGAWESVFGQGGSGGGEEGKGEEDGEGKAASSTKAAAAATATAKTIKNPPAALTPPPPPPKTGLRYHHVVMNLPATAIEFLDAFRGSLRPELFVPSSGGEGNGGAGAGEPLLPLPRVHVYCFERAGEPASTTIARVAGYLGAEPEDAAVRLVRDVSPNKRMVCVSFTLPASVALAAKAEAEEEKTEEEALLRAKRQKTDGGVAD